MTGANESPEVLAARGVEGDGQAVDRLVRVLHDDVYNLAIRMLGNRLDAEDATQEILLEVVTRLGSFRGRAASGRGCGGWPRTTCCRPGGAAGKRRA